MVKIKLIKSEGTPLRIAPEEKKDKKKHAERDYAILFLRTGIAFSFFYVAVSIFLNPSSWMGFVPKFAEIILPASKLVYGHAILDGFLGIWLLTNRKIFYASVLSAANLFFITVLNLGAMEIVFRDVTILFSAVALAFLTKNFR